MGLLQKACLTYDQHQNLAGLMEANKTPLAPCSHTTVQAGICITVNQDGKFVKADAVDKNDPKIIIPVTEASIGRTSSTIAPHPLCEQLKYLIPENKAHYEKYVEQLKSWTDSAFTHPKLAPILQYAQGQTIVSDLLPGGFVTLKDGKIEKEKTIICWRVIGLGEVYSGPCWTDRELFQAFDLYYQDQKKKEEPVLCMVTGEPSPPANQHMKGIVASHGNAKLISSNDNSNFTYRGRFTCPLEAESVGYLASQKAHNVLRWLIATQGVHYGSRYFICWEPEMLKLPDPFSAFDDFGPAEGSETPETAPRMSFVAYQEDLQNTLKGWKTSLPSDRAQAVIAAFDAATSGRLALTYYNELMASDFLERLYAWDLTCCWIHGKYGIQSPSIWKIVTQAYGTQRGSGKNAKLEVDEQLLSQQVQRLFACRVDRGQMPTDIVQRLVQRASTPQAYEPHVWKSILLTACAVIRKYHYDHYKEEWTMALEPDKKDCSYQYGRLLAVLEKAERESYDQDETRETNAIKLMSVFAQRPQYASRIVLQRVKTAYLPRLRTPSRRAYYDKLIQEIFVNLSAWDESELNRPLGDTYLMGYYLQRQALYTKNKDTTEE